MRYFIYKNWFIWKIGLLAVVAVLLAMPLSPIFANQSSMVGYLEKTGTHMDEYGKVQDLPTIIGQVIKIVLGVLGVVLLVLIVYAGFKWMTAGGEKENVEKAQKLIVNAVIGLLICMAAYAITHYVVIKLTEVTTGQPAPGGVPDFVDI